MSCGIVGQREADKRWRAATSKEVGLHFGKTSKWAYRILASLEDAFRICASNGGKPITWWVKDEL